MGALKGSIAVRRYKILEPLPEDVRRKFMRGLRAHAFVPIDPRADGDRSAGWVSILDGEDADLHPEGVFFVAPGGEQLRVTLRLDLLKPPVAEVRRQLALRAQEVEEERGRPLSRGEKRALKLEVLRSLKLRAFPRVKLVDLVWFLDEGRLYLWSQAKNVCETFLDLFAKTFGLRLDVDGAARWARESVAREALDRLEPTPELWQGFDGVRPLGGAAEDEEAV